MNPLTCRTRTPLTARDAALQQPSSVRTGRQVVHGSRHDTQHPDLSPRQAVRSPVQIRPPLLQALNPSAVNIDVGKRLAMLPKDSQRTVAQAVARLISDSRQLSGPDLLRRLRQEQQGIDMGWKNRGHVDWVLKSEADQRNIVHTNLWGLVGACILRRDQADFRQHLDDIEQATLAALKPRSRQRKLTELEAPAKPPRPFDPLQSGIRLNGVWTTKADLARKANQQTAIDDREAPPLRPVESNFSKRTRDVNRPSPITKLQPLSLEVIPEASEQKERDEELAPSGPSHSVMNSPHVTNMKARVMACRDQLKGPLKQQVLNYVQNLQRSLTVDGSHVVLISRIQADSSTGNGAATWVHGVMRSGNGFCGIGGESAEKFQTKLTALLKLSSE